jgi:EAL and modified HD-GYP domain-containing signal transduction protein
MFGAIKRMLGVGREPVFNTDPFGREKTSSQKSAAASVSRVEKIVEPMLRRDELIDMQTRIAGYRFGLQSTDATQALSEQAKFDALREANLLGFAERRLALIVLDSQQWFKHDYRALIGRHTAFLLQIPHDSESQLRWREVVRSIRDAGAQVVLSGADFSRDYDAVRDCADMLLLDFPSYSLLNFELLTARLRREMPQLKLIAEHVASWAERRYCVSRGIDFCSGPFTTCNDDEQQSGEISQRHLILIEMLNLVRRDAEMCEIVDVAKRDPGVVIKIMSMANSPAMGLTSRVTSFDQAILVLGRDQLYRWLSIGFFRAGIGAPRDEVLLELALTRGRLLELLGPLHHDKNTCDELFLMGLLSLLDCLLGLPMAKLLERLHLSAPICDALLRSDGPLAPYLMLAIAVEKEHAPTIGHLSAQLNLSDSDVATASIAAMKWSEEAVLHGN